MEIIQANVCTARKCNCLALDWMYQGGMLTHAEAEKRNEEAILAGKPVALGIAAEKATRVSNQMNTRRM